MYCCWRNSAFPWRAPGAAWPVLQTAEACGWPALLDCLVHTQPHRLGNRDAQRLGRFQIEAGEPLRRRPMSCGPWGALNGADPC
jgi:hypothetical protein